MNPSPKTIILEIRAGVGGNEASIFAADLANMYSRFASKEGWTASILDESKNDLGGYKEVVMELSGEGVFDKLKQESGSASRSKSACDGKIRQSAHFHRFSRRFAQ